ncbi:MAG: hypothetical protein CMN32_05660 [Saprospirales bacterium]|nr:hypothetical protein [Saprospirales bacterium]
MKKLFLAILILGILGAAVGFYFYNKPLDAMAGQKADFKLTAEELFNAFENDEAAANAKYLDKVVEVRGKVLEVKPDEDGKTGILLDAGGMFGVNCKLDDLAEDQRQNFTEGEEVSLKCICTGKLMDVVLVRCVEVE